MALYDGTFDWYDMFVPGSQITPLFGEGTKQIGNLMNDISGATAQNEFNAQQAQIEREWQEQMRKTAYQDTVADMKAAGLNPAMLYASGGNATGTPTGATAHNGTGMAMNMVGQLASFVNSINSARQVDTITKTNELTGGSANKIYRSVANIASMLSKFMA